jgi:hypothetical protein
VSRGHQAGFINLGRKVRAGIMVNRRDFMKGSLAVLGTSTLTSGWASHGAVSFNSGPRLAIDYPQKNIPALEIPPYLGKRYEDKVPDTLDIATRCELAINAMTGITDPRYDYEVYWEAQFFRNPAIMMHDHNDWVQSCEGFMEALPLLRVATGSNLNAQVDEVWERVNLASIGPDGLIYEVLNGTPWSRLNPWSFHKVWMADGSIKGIDDPSLVLATTPSKCGRIIGTMTVYYLHDGNPVWTQTVERMIQRLSQLAVERGGFTYLPNWAFEPFAKCGPDAPMPTGWDAVDYGNLRMIQGLTQYYKVTGYEPARKLAAGLTAFGLGHTEYYDSQGRFLFCQTERDSLMNSKRMRRNYPEAKDAVLGGHFHNHTIGALSILEYAAAVKDQTALEWVNSGYQWARNQGSNLVGFFPEIIINNRYLACESCEVADMIAISIKLTQAGVGDYWDDVDRWTRNTFAEQQLVNGDWIPEFAKTQPAQPVASNETADRLVERLRGSFAGWASGNEFADTIGIQQCCLGNSARTLYYIWQSILERQGEVLRVNLLLNRASPWADVYSHIPYEGRVDLKFKKFCQRVLVRAPEWITSGSRELVCKMNGTPRNVRWQGRYVDAGVAHPGDNLVVTFPIAERNVKETIGDVPYTLTVKGNTVTTIDPPGKVGPLYQRAYYRANHARMRTVSRFVPDETVIW